MCRSTLQTPIRLDGPQRASVLELADVDRGGRRGAAALGPGPQPARERRGRATSSRSRTAGSSATPSSTARAPNCSAQPGALEPLLDALAARPRPDVELWAHGTRSRLLPVLDGRGYERDRVLWQLRWPVAPLAPVPLPADVAVRPFVVGRDEAAWLAVNAAAFAHHPEQGGWTLADLLGPRGRAVVRPGRRPARGRARRRAARIPLDEAAQPVTGRGLRDRPSPRPPRVGTWARALLVAGLEHLRASGVTEVLLYVDDSNTGRGACTRGTGFTRHDHDVQYRLAAVGSRRCLAAVHAAATLRFEKRHVSALPPFTVRSSGPCRSATCPP